MSWRTFFQSRSVQYTTTTGPLGELTDGTAWKPASVHISEVTMNKRWLVVFVATDPVPAVWNAITDGLTIGCEERTLTVILTNLIANNPDVTHKIRFEAFHEFWAFVAHIAFARVYAYNQATTEVARASEQAVEQENAMTEG